MGRKQYQAVNICDGDIKEKRPFFSAVIIRCVGTTDSGMETDGVLMRMIRSHRCLLLGSMSHGAGAINCFFPQCVSTYTLPDLQNNIMRGGPEEIEKVQEGEAQHGRPPR